MTIANLVVEGEIVFENMELARNVITVTNVEFKHAFRLFDEHAKRFAFLYCRFHVLVLNKDILPHSFGGNWIDILRLDSFLASAESLINYPANRIIVVNTIVDFNIGFCLRPERVLEFELCTFEGATLRQKSTKKELFERLSITECTANTTLTISGWHAEWLKISEVVAENIRFEYCSVSHLDMSSTIVKGATEFTSVSFHKASTQAANLNTEIKASKSFKLIESEISEIKWSFCDWSKIEMYITDARVRKVWLHGSSGPREVIPLNGHWKEAVDLLGLFEANAKAQGHIADAITNRANALRAYRKYIFKQRRDWMDQATLWFSEVISDYGANWIRAIAVLLVTGMLTFMLLLEVADPRVTLFSIDNSTPGYVLTYTGYFLQFLSPIHKDNFLGVDLCGLGVIIDSVARIWLGFVIYQVVRSTRKFVS